MDNKPLLQDRPPAYAPSSASYEYAQTYGTIPPPGYQQQPPPYSYPASGYVPPVSVGVQPPVCPTSNYSNTYTIIQQPTAASVVVVGGCPACSMTEVNLARWTHFQAFLHPSSVDNQWSYGVGNAVMGEEKAILHLGSSKNNQLITELRQRCSCNCTILMMLVS
ncbi:membrane protein BRI3 isoform X1 [Mobula birostris]|uniref:membrane protein BRI3 isoform X1 n=1 Tax=Mobula birostris TaxID=1983395 RepID=UPI003B27D9D0